MRILWVKVGGLWPPNTGGRLRSFHLLSELSRRHRVTVLTTHPPHEDPDGLKAHLPHCRSVVSIPYAPPKWRSARFPLALLRSWFSPLPVDLWKCRVAPLRAAVAQLIEARAVDLVVADFIFAVPNLPAAVPVPVVFFAHNVEHRIWQRLGDNAGSAGARALLGVEWRKMRRCEADACRRASLTLAVSPADRDALAALAPGASVCAVPTGVDVSYFAPSHAPETPNSMVYVGSMDWQPNEDAVVHFIEEILPRIRREVPGASLTVVGRNPSRRLELLAAKADVAVTGTVHDVRPFVAAAAVNVVPLRIGGGTRLKIFEALAMGKAVVSTTIGAEGLPLIDGAHLMRADEPAAFARAVVSLLQNPRRRALLGLAGRKLVEQNYAWERVAAAFEARCVEALARAPVPEAGAAPRAAIDTGQLRAATRTPAARRAPSRVQP